MTSRPVAVGSQARSGAEGRSGFLALAFSNLPPMRQFGIVSAIAFAFSMLADFTALTAALWVFLRQKPDAKP